MGEPESQSVTVAGLEVARHYYLLGESRACAVGLLERHGDGQGVLKSRSGHHHIPDSGLPRLADRDFERAGIYFISARTAFVAYGGHGVGRRLQDGGKGGIQIGDADAGDVSVFILPLLPGILVHGIDAYRILAQGMGEHGGRNAALETAAHIAADHHVGIAWNIVGQGMSSVLNRVSRS